MQLRLFLCLPYIELMRSGLMVISHLRPLGQQTEHNLRSEETDLRQETNQGKKHYEV